MKKKGNFIENMKNTLIITRIRITNFIREHKYISGVIGVFLLSSIIALVAFANNNHNGEFTVTEESVIEKTISSSEQITSINSFSTLVYDISYKLNLPDVTDEQEKSAISRIVKIEATMPDDLDAAWQKPFDDDEYEISDDGKTLTATIYDVGLGVNSKQLYLDIYNEHNKTIQSNFVVYESTASDNDKQTKRTSPTSSSGVTVNSQEVNLTAKVIGGDAYKVDETSTSGRYAPFAILVGFDNPNNRNSLEGLYFNPNLDITLEANQSYTDGSSIGIKLMENIEANEDENISRKTYYGVLDKEDKSNILNSLPKFNSLPHYIHGTSYESVYDSGVVQSLKQTESLINKGENNKSSTKVVYLIGPQNIIINKDDNYVEYGITDSENGTSLCSGSQAKCLITIYNSNEEIVSEIDTSEAEKYTIKYKYSENNNDNVVTLVRTVEVKENAEATDLTSAQTMKTASQQLSADEIYLSIDGDYTPYVYLDDRSINCSSNATTTTNCTVSYINDETGETGFDKSSAGTYTAVYTITDSNEFTLQTTNKIHVQEAQAIYTLKISNIKSDGTFFNYNNFISLGSYFVTALSPRGTAEGKIVANLKATANGEAVASVDNPVLSYGSKGTELSLYNGNGTQEKLNSNNYVSYGEEIILSSVFDYTINGDNTIGKVTNIVPLATPSYLKALGVSNFNQISDNSGSEVLFTLTRYGSETTDSTPYYVEGSGYEGISVKYYSCSLESRTCTGYDDYDDAISADGELAYVEYTLTGVKPGSKVDFRLRVKTNVGVQGAKRLTTLSTFNNGENPSTATTIINITPFKARTKVFIGDKENDVVVDGANTNTSTIKIYPSVTMPAQDINTNAAGISDLSNVVINVSLPTGINYVYNEDYDIPKTTSNRYGTILTYTIKNKKINDWFDPITIDVNYSINIESNTTLEVPVQIQAEASDGSSDISSEELRTTTRYITYMNNKEISSGLSSSTGISKNTKFNVTASLYNNSSNDYSNIDLIMVLPFIDEANKYTGTYNLSGTTLPDGSECTTINTPGIIDDSTLASTQIPFEDCTNYKDENYDGVTAIKIPIETLNHGSLISKTITITPNGNKTDDVYQIKAYFINNGKVNKINPLKVSVISKKITGTVWEDFDWNGIMDDTENKVEDVTLKLYDATTDEFIKSTTSDSKGKYSIADLTPGTYYVVAEFNEVKYGVSPYAVVPDKAISSSFASSKTDDSDDNVSISDEEGESTKKIIVKTGNIEVTKDTKSINDINLGLTLKKVYSVKLTKYVTKAITTNRLGVSTITDFENLSLAKLNVRDMSNLSIKVIYTIELENVGYYPGYIYKVKDYVPDGMVFNENYEENKGWVMSEYGYLENESLKSELIQGGEKKYLTIAFDIDRKEAGSFINRAVIEEDDLQILKVYDPSEEGE